MTSSEYKQWKRMKVVTRAILATTKKGQSGNVLELRIDLDLYASRIKEHKLEQERENIRSQIKPDESSNE